ncbi:MAG: pilus assembly protein PilM [Lachnospiraceae bacterium]|nr:pilus assembly protein PilM [Lachnospiraceae bacterium]
MADILSIVINNNVLRIAQLHHRSGGTTRVRRLLERECPKELVDDSTVLDPEAFAGFLKLQLASAGIRSRNVIFTLPADKVMTREVILPNMSDARIRQIVTTNAGEYFPINLEEYVIGFYRVAAVRQAEDAAGAEQEGQENQEDNDDLASDSDVELTTFEKKHPDKERKTRKKRRERAGRKKKKDHAPAADGEEGAEKRSKKKKRGEIRVMAIAAPNEQVSTLYEMAAYLKMRVESIDFIGNSVFRLAAMQVGKEPTLTVDISGDHTSMTFFDNGDMIMQRNMDFGMDQVIDIVAREKWVSAERADEMLRTTKMINEDLPPNSPLMEQLYFAIDMIRRTMIYYTRNRGMRPVEKVLLMGDAIYYHGVRDILESQLSVSVISVDQIKGVFIPRTSLMHDQAMRFLDNYGAVIKPVGFVSQELTQSKAESSGKHIYRIILAGAFAVSAISIAIPATKYLSLKNDTDHLESEVRSLKGADAVLNAYNEAKTKNDDVHNVRGITASHNDVLSAFIADLEEMRPSGLSIESFTIDEGNVSMMVLASGKDVVAAMLRSLEGMNNVSEVEASAIASYYEGNAETVTCTISCTLTNKVKRDYELTETSQEAGQ